MLLAFCSRSMRRRRRSAQPGGRRRAPPAGSNRWSTGPCPRTHRLHQRRVDGPRRRRGGRCGRAEMRWLWGPDSHGEKNDDLPRRGALTARSATTRPRANGGGITDTGGGLVVVASAIPRNSAAPGGGIENRNGGTRAPVAGDLSGDEGGLVDLT